MVNTYILAVSIDGEMYRFNAFDFKSLLMGQYHGKYLQGRHTAHGHIL
jgi:hypothetical protein